MVKSPVKHGHLTLIWGGPPHLQRIPIDHDALWRADCLSARKNLKLLVICQKSLEPQSLSSQENCCVRFGVKWMTHNCVSPTSWSNASPVHTSMHTAVGFASMYTDDLSYPSFLQVQLQSSRPTPVHYPFGLSDLGYVFTSVFLHLFL